MPAERKGAGTAGTGCAGLGTCFLHSRPFGASTLAASSCSRPEQNQPGLCSKSDLLPAWVMGDFIEPGKADTDASYHCGH